MSETYNLEGKSLLFLVRDIGSIQSALTFLQRREISVEVETDLKEAVQRMEKFPPDFFCVSVNYPHTKVGTIPLAIEQAYGIETILFSERPDRRTNGILARSKHRHLIFGSLSGPALTLKIRRVLRERQNREELERQLRSNQEERERRSEGEEGSQKQLGSENNIVSEQVIKVSGQIMDDDLSASIQAQYGMTGTENEATYHKPAADHPSAAQMLAASGPSEPVVAGHGFKQKGSIIIQPGIRPSTSTSIDSRRDPYRDKEALIIHPNFGGTSSGRTGGPSAAKKRTSDLPSPSDKERAAEEVIRACMSTALSRSCRHQEHLEEIAILETVAQLGLIPVNSENLRGYIMIALAKETYMSDAFLSEFNTHFRASLLEQGSIFTLEDPMTVRLSPFDVRKMAQQASEISVAGQHLDSQALVSFIRRTRVLPQIKHNSPDMALIDIRDVPPETPLTFETFVHLPLNKKFVRYVKNGGTISEKQKERLQASTTERFAIHSRDQAKYKTFFAENELAPEILPYQTDEEE